MQNKDDDLKKSDAKMSSIFEESIKNKKIFRILYIYKPEEHSVCTV